MRKSNENEKKKNNENIGKIMNQMNELETNKSNELERVKSKSHIENKNIQDQLTETQAELSSLRDEVAHQTGKCNSLQQRLREAEAELTAKNDIIEVITNIIYES